ncbi:hypothetical protein H9P43_009371 [Blastocladiella emersonii ATCC 22665]|nr:hypothetical protein H9P43_009371 [Blastocladiella emersonii ATCC 22665]
MALLFNDPLASDAHFLPGDATEPIFASRAILIPTSPFFDRMFRGALARPSSPTKPIELPAWSHDIFVLALVHCYTDWLPGSPLPDSIKPALSKLAVDPADLDVDDWRSMMKFAGMLECPRLASAARSQAVALIDEELKTITLAGSEAKKE